MAVSDLDPQPPLGQAELVEVLGAASESGTLFRNAWFNCECRENRRYQGLFTREVHRLIKSLQRCDPTLDVESVVSLVARDGGQVGREAMLLLADRREYQSKFGESLRPEQLKLHHAALVELFYHLDDYCTLLEEEKKALGSTMQCVLHGSSPADYRTMADDLTETEFSFGFDGSSYSDDDFIVQLYQRYFEENPARVIDLVEMLQCDNEASGERTKKVPLEFLTILALSRSARQAVQGTEPQDRAPTVPLEIKLKAVKLLSDAAAEKNHKVSDPAFVRLRTVVRSTEIEKEADIPSVKRQTAVFERSSRILTAIARQIGESEDSARAFLDFYKDRATHCSEFCRAVINRICDNLRDGKPDYQSRANLHKLMEYASWWAQVKFHFA